MIAVDEIQQPAPGDAPAGPVATVDMLDAEEHARLQYIDSLIEPHAINLRGDMFHAHLSSSLAPMKIISALKMLWESGGWTVGVFEMDGGVQMVFVKARRASPAKAIRDSLELRASEEKEKEEEKRGSRDAEQKELRPRLPRAIATKASRTSTPLLLRMPTRGRPDQALDVLTAYRELAADHVPIEVVIDADDASMNNAQVLQALCDLDCTVTVGNHKNKIDAVNGGRVDDWAIMALISDDMVPVAKGYDRRIVEDMQRRFPLFDGALNYNDGYNKDHVRPGKPVLNTLPILGRHLYDQFGYVYHYEYGSLYCDDELTELLTAMNRMVFVDELLIEHRHHAAGKAAHDALYKFNDETYARDDRELFMERAQLRQPKSQFAFDAPPMWLSILVCSTTKRADSLRRLVSWLRAQMQKFPREVELCVEIDGGEMSVGAKRQKLLERSRGKYVAFCDDDDLVSHDYVERVLAAVKTEPDCASLVGVMTTNGQKPERFEHSLKYSSWFTDPVTKIHARTPNHISSIKRELALQVGFVSKNVGEDHEFSRRLYPLLKTEASTGDSPLYFYFFVPQKSVQARGAK